MAGACLFVCASLCPSPADAFTLFAFKSRTAIENDNIFRWDKPSVDEPLTLSYAVDADFLSGEDAATAADAKAAVERALQEWSDATGGRIVFQEAPFPAVRNLDPPDLRVQWEGPAWDLFFQDPTFWQSLGYAPGWGANVDVFSAPPGTAFESNGVSYEMKPGQLGFAVVNLSGDIKSTEIYLNEAIDWTTSQPGSGATPPFDVETVILHELGHCLGLEHPNEAADGGCLTACSSQQQICNNGVNLDPFTYEFGAPWSPQDVMHACYTGQKRILTNDEIGGMAFLYPPRGGDISGDGEVSTLDFARALAIADGSLSPNPYELAAGDFMDRNGRVGALELSTILDWATSSEQTGQPVTLGPDPKEITLRLVPSPGDVGVGGPLEIAIEIENPQNVQIVSWELDLAYDAAPFTPSEFLIGDFLPQPLPIFDLADDGAVDLTVISATDTTASSGLLGRVVFDVDLPAAVANVNSPFTIMNAHVIIDLAGQVVEFGGRPEETLIIEDASVFASDLDVTGNGVVNLFDLYAWHEGMIDVDQDGSIDDADRVLLVERLREGEVADIVAGP